MKPTSRSYRRTYCLGFAQFPPKQDEAGLKVLEEGIYLGGGGGGGGGGAQLPQNRMKPT